VFNVTFSDISAISWRPVLVVEEAVVPRENHVKIKLGWKMADHVVDNKMALMRRN
jgi:hypothetical protein